MQATMTEAVRQWAYSVGINRQASAYILSDYDTWETNPHYVGPPPCVHPEDDHMPDFTVHIEYKDACADAKRAAAYLDCVTRIEHYKGRCWVVWYK